MQQRVMNLTLIGLTGVMVAGGIAAGVTASADAERSPEPPVAVAQSLSRPPTAARLPGQKSPARHSPGKGGKAGKAAESSKVKALVSGTTTASYFFDDGSGINGDTGKPASGLEMRKGMFASPSWPMRTKVKVSYKGRSVTGIIGDRGPGEPSSRGIMLDLDTYTFRYLFDGEKPDSKYDAGVSAGHLKGVKYEVLKWGSGPGKKGRPQPFNP